MTNVITDTSAVSGTPFTMEFGLSSATGFLNQKVFLAEPVAGAFITPAQNLDNRGTGTIAAGTLNAALSVPLNNGEGVAGFRVTGLTAAGATLTIEAAKDGGTTYDIVNGVTEGTGALITTLTADQAFAVSGAGKTNVRLRVSSAGSGSITVAYNASSVSSMVALATPLPAGSNALGSVSINGNVPVTGTFWPATQPVSGTFWQATQPISAAALPLPSGAATSALQTTINATLGSPMQQTGGSVASIGSGNIATAQISVGTSPTLIAASRAGRNEITAVNMGTSQVYLGGSGVTTSNGIPLIGTVGAAVTISFQGALYGIVASSTNTVGVIEVY